MVKYQVQTDKDKFELEDDNNKIIYKLEELKNKRNVYYVPREYITVGYRAG
jgi:hypothetical protein